MMSSSSESSGGPLLNDRGQVVGIVLDKQQPAIEELAEGGIDETELAGRRNYAVKANQVRLMLRNVKSYDRTSTILFGTNDIDEILEKMRASVVLVTVE